VSAAIAAASKAVLPRSSAPQKTLAKRSPVPCGHCLSLAF